MLASKNVNYAINSSKSQFETEGNLTFCATLLWKTKWLEAVQAGCPMDILLGQLSLSVDLRSSPDFAASFTNSPNLLPEDQSSKILRYVHTQKRSSINTKPKQSKFTISRIIQLLKSNLTLQKKKKNRRGKNRDQIPSLKAQINRQNVEMFVQFGDFNNGDEDQQIKVREKSSNRIAPEKKLQNRH